MTYSLLEVELPHGNPDYGSLSVIEVADFEAAPAKVPIPTDVKINFWFLRQFTGRQKRLLFIG
jgi:hypothetical protein